MKKEAAVLMGVMAALIYLLATGQWIMAVILFVMVVIVWGLLK